MTRSRILLWALLGLLAGLAMGYHIVSGLQPPTSADIILRNETGVADLSIVFGFPIVYLVVPWVAEGASGTAASGYNRPFLLGVVASVALNWAFWAAIWSALLGKLWAKRSSRAPVS